MAREVAIYAKRPLQLGNLNTSPRLKVGNNVISQSQYDLVRNTWYFAALLSSGDIRVQDNSEPEGQATIEFHSSGAIVVDPGVSDKQIADLKAKGLAGLDFFGNDVVLPQEPVGSPIVVKKEAKRLIRKLNRK